MSPTSLEAAWNTKCCSYVPEEVWGTLGTNEEDKGQRGAEQGSGRAHTGAIQGPYRGHPVLTGAGLAALLLVLDLVAPPVVLLVVAAVGARRVPGAAYLF